MLDLEGKELEVGGIYHILGSGNCIVIAKYHHETEFSFVFKPIKNYKNVQDEPVIHTWKRIISKYWSSATSTKSIGVIKVSQGVIDKYNIS